MTETAEESIKPNDAQEHHGRWRSQYPQRTMNAYCLSEDVEVESYASSSYPQAFPESSDMSQSQDLPQNDQQMFPRTVQPIMSVQTFTHIVADAVTTAIRYNSPAGQPGRHIFTDSNFEYDVVWGVSSVRPIADMRQVLQQYPTAHPALRAANAMLHQQTISTMFPISQQTGYPLPPPHQILRSMGHDFAYHQASNITSSFNSDDTMVGDSPDMDSFNNSRPSVSMTWASDSSSGSNFSSQTGSLTDDDDTVFTTANSSSHHGRKTAIRKKRSVKRTPSKTNVETDHSVPRRGKGSRTKNEAYYRSHGAIAKPSNGKKREGDRCLTCIKYDRACRGNILKNGNCDTCCALRNARNQKRSCLWADPEEGVWTYEAAQEVAGSRKIFNNTTEALSERGKGTLFQQAKAEVDRAVRQVRNQKIANPNSDASRLVRGLTEKEGDGPNLFMSVLDYPTGSAKRKAMQDIMLSCKNAIQSLDADDDVLNALLNAAEAHAAKCTAPSNQGVEELTELDNMAEHYEAIIQRMNFMKRIGRKIRKDKVQTFLEYDHE